MAYTPHNLLCRVEEFQQLYRDNKEEGVTNIYIYKKYAYPRYHISMRTFYDWLTINVALERKKQLEKQPQGSLF